MRRTYIAIDLKSYYASVECMERGLDPMTTNLVVADLSRTEKTICLAVSPSLKAYGIPGRARLFEVVERVKEVNAERRRKAGGNLFEKSCDAHELATDPSRAVGYLVAPPQMAKYIQISTQIYNVYLKYIAPEDIHVYSIDEVMMDVTSYLETYHMTARELAKAMILDVLRTTGITATAGIGTNLYLCKVAMDIMAKHVAPDEDGVRIAELDEMSYRRQLWAHRPLTDFWRVGRGYRGAGTAAQGRGNQIGTRAQNTGSDAGHQEEVRQERHFERRELFRRRDRPRAQRPDRRAQGMSGKYDDIIDLPHPTSQNHPRMSLYDRAAQFSPFAALTGHHAAIAETGRLTDRRIELDESEITRVDAELQHLQELLPGRPTVSITYFVPDERKNGGSYQTVTGEVKRIDAVAGMIQMTDRREIPIEDVFSVAVDVV